MTTRTVNFEPTPDMINSAEIVMLAIAHHSLISESVKAYQRSILDRYQFHIDPYWTSSSRIPDQVILDPNLTYLLKPEDFREYDAQCEAERRRRGFAVMRDGNCPLLEAESTLLDAKKVMVDTMVPITGIDSVRLLSKGMEYFNTVVELSLKLLAQHANPQRRLPSNEVVCNAEQQ